MFRRTEWFLKALRADLANFQQPIGNFVRVLFLHLPESLTGRGPLGNFVFAIRTHGNFLSFYPEWPICSFVPSNKPGYLSGNLLLLNYNRLFND